jgi:hypothetical protein
MSGLEREGAFYFLPVDGISPSLRTPGLPCQDFAHWLTLDP